MAPAVDVAVLLAPLREALAVAAVRPVVLLEVVEGRADLAHKLLPRVRLQVAVVLAPLREALAVVAVAVVVVAITSSTSSRRGCVPRRQGCGSRCGTCRTCGSKREAGRICGSGCGTGP